MLIFVTSQISESHLAFYVFQLLVFNILRKLKVDMLHTVISRLQQENIRQITCIPKLKKHILQYCFFSSPTQQKSTKSKKAWPSGYQLNGGGYDKDLWLCQGMVLCPKQTSVFLLLASVPEGVSSYQYSCCLTKKTQRSQ